MQKKKKKKKKSQLPFAEDVAVEPVK